MSRNENIVLFFGTIAFVALIATILTWVMPEKGTSFAEIGEKIFTRATSSKILVATNTQSSTSTTTSTTTLSLDTLKTVTDAATGITFSYREYKNEYFSFIDWPPKLQLLKEMYECTPGGNEYDIEGKTEERKILEKNYCVKAVKKIVDENIVSQYSYLTNYASGTIVFTFSTEQKNCENFKDEERFFCQTELEKIDLSKIITDIFESIKK